MINSSPGISKCIRYEQIPMQFKGSRQNTKLFTFLHSTAGDTGQRPHGKAAHHTVNIAISQLISLPSSDRQCKSNQKKALGEHWFLVELLRWLVICSYKCKRGSTNIYMNRLCFFPTLYSISFQNLNVGSNLFFIIKIRSQIYQGIWTWRTGTI